MFYVIERGTKHASFNYSRTRCCSRSNDALLGCSHCTNCTHTSRCLQFTKGSHYMPYGHMTHGHVTHGHVTHGHVTHGHVTHGHVTHGHVTHGHVTHGHASSSLLVLTRLLFRLFTASLVPFCVPRLAACDFPFSFPSHLLTHEQFQLVCDKFHLFRKH